jgi:ABC-2 type transport system permease protein
LGGLAIVFKRVQQPLQIFQVVVIGLVIAPVETWPWLKYMPLVWGTHLIKKVMVDGTRILELGSGDVLFLLVHSFAYFVGGLAAFRFFERKARDRALLGHY